MEIVKKVAPHLVSQIAPGRNGHVNQIKANTLTKLWWKCPDAECDHHVWEARIHDRSHKKSGCPYCTGKRVCECNCLSALYPQISKQWHPTKNGDLSPDNVASCSKKKVWWLCSESKCHHVHEWQAVIGVRVLQLTGCPWCAPCGRSKKVCECESVAEKYPELLNEWIAELNIKDPYNTLSGSNELIWWKCGYCSHQYERTVYDRTRIEKRSCPNCESNGFEQEEPNEFIIKDKDEYTMGELRRILKENNAVGRSSKDKDKLYGLVDELYKELNQHKFEDMLRSSKQENDQISDDTVSLEDADESVDDVEESVDDVEESVDDVEEDIKEEESLEDVDEDIKEEEECTDLIPFTKSNFHLFIDSNGMINATKLAKACNKRLNNYLASKQTKAFLSALTKLTKFQSVDLVVSKEGNKGGTYFHRLVVYNYIQSISGEFAAHVSHILDNYFLRSDDSKEIQKDISELDLIWTEKCQKLLCKLDKQTIALQDNEIAINGYKKAATS